MNDQWDQPDEPPPRRDVWGANPCGCRACNVCSYFGHAPMIDRRPPKPTDTPLTPKPAATLFD